MASHGGVEHTDSTDGPRRSGFIVGVVWAISVANRFLPTYLFLGFGVDSTLCPLAQSSLKLSSVCSVGLICLLSNRDKYVGVLIHHHVHSCFSSFRHRHSAILP